MIDFDYTPKAVKEIEAWGAVYWHRENLKLQKQVAALHQECKILRSKLRKEMKRER